MYTVETLDSPEGLRDEWWMGHVSSALAVPAPGSPEGGGPVVSQRSGQYRVLGWREDRAPREPWACYIPRVDGSRDVAQSASAQAALVCLDREPGQADATDDVACLALLIAGDRVGTRLPCDPGVTAVRSLDPTQGVGRIMRNQLRLVHQERDHIDADSFDLMLDHVVDLLALATAPHAAEKSTAMSWTLLTSLRQIIRERAHDPDLNGAELAACVGWSLRHVQAQLRLYGTTPTELIREERLKLARLRLKSPSARGLSIGQIAAASGFRDLGTFSNCYQRRYGERPSATRSRPAAGEAAEHLVAASAPV